MTKRKKITQMDIKIKTRTSNDKYWIRVQRNNAYIPHERHIQTHTQPQPQLQPQTQPQTVNIDDWQVVPSRKMKAKKRDQMIYYWMVIEHNLFDQQDKSHRLFFIEPDTTQIENADQTNIMAIDDQHQIHLIHSHLKHKGMKLFPTFYIARNISQICEALKSVKYCVIKETDHIQQLLNI